MARSRRDGAIWARIARRGGTDPLISGTDAEFLTLDATTGAVLVTGAGAAPTATALRIADGDATLGEANVVAGRLEVATQHTQPLTDAQVAARGLATDGALVPLLDGIEALLTAIRDRPDNTLTEVQLRALPVAVTQPGLASEVTLAAINANTDAVEALLTTLRDTVYRRSDPLPTGSNVIGSVIDRLEARTLLVLPSAARATGGVSDPFVTSDLSRAAIDVNVTAVEGVAPELRVFLDRMGADGNWYPVWTPAARTAVGTLSTTVGQGMAIGQSLAASCRFRWEITGTTPSFTFSASVVGK